MAPLPIYIVSVAYGKCANPTRLLINDIRVTTVVRTNLERLPRSVCPVHVHIPYTMLDLGAMAHADLGMRSEFHMVMDTYGTRTSLDTIPFLRAETLRDGNRVTALSQQEPQLSSLPKHTRTLGGA